MLGICITQYYPIKYFRAFKRCRLNDLLSQLFNLGDVGLINSQPPPSKIFFFISTGLALYKSKFYSINQMRIMATIWLSFQLSSYSIPLGIFFFSLLCLSLILSFQSYIELH